MKAIMPLDPASNAQALQESSYLFSSYWIVAIAVVLTYDFGWISFVSLKHTNADVSSSYFRQRGEKSCLLPLTEIDFCCGQLKHFWVSPSAFDCLRTTSLFRLHVALAFDYGAMRLLPRELYFGLPVAKSATQRESIRCVIARFSERF